MFDLAYTVWFLVGAFVLAAGVVIGKTLWPQVAPKIIQPPGPPLDQRPCWANDYGRLMEEDKLRAPASYRLNFYGRATITNGTIQVEGEGGRDWLALQGDPVRHLPVGGATEVTLEPQNLDNFLGDLNVAKLAARVKAVINGGPTREFKLALDLETQRQRAITGQPFVISEKAVLPQSGMIQLEVTNPHPFRIKLDKITVRGLGMKLRQPLAAFALDPGETSFPILYLTGVPANWKKEIKAHLKARVSYQGWRGVKLEQPFKLIPDAPLPGFSPHQDHAAVDVTVTEQVSGAPPQTYWMWAGAMALPTIPMGYEVSGATLTVHYHGRHLNSSETRTFSWPDPGDTSGLRLHGESLRVTSDGSWLQLSSWRERKAHEWITGVEVKFTLTHEESGFPTKVVHTYAYNLPI